MDEAELTGKGDKEVLPRLDEPEVIIDSVTLARLIDEVRNAGSFTPGAYNRVHNRHNRS